MGKQSVVDHVVNVKTTLAEKYERKARTCKSKHAKARLVRRAERYRQQAANAQKGGVR